MSMIATTTRRHRILSEDEILRIVPTLPYRTSWELYWPGVEVHRYRLPAGETKEHTYPRLAVFLSQSPEPYRLEIRTGGETVRRTIDRECVSIMPANVTSSGRRDTPGELTAIFLDPVLNADMAVAFTGVDNPDIMPQVGIRDPLVRAIGDRLDAELVASRPSPRIFIESLAAALGAHIISRYSAPVLTGCAGADISGTQLRRSIEHMKDNLEQDLTLDDLAAAAAMSKYHFAKSFKHAMGVAPHQYLVRLRMEKARKLLATDTLSVEEVANSVGYTDKAHFAEQFRRWAGVSPSHYRRLR